MASQYRHRRTSDPAVAFPPLEPGEISVNTANRQLAVGDANGATIGNPIVLLGIRLFDTRARYATGDLMVRSGVIYRALVDVAPGAFNGAQWEPISGTLNPAYVQKAGDTMTGDLTLAGDPINSFHAATKQYADSKLAKAGGTMTGNLVLAGDPSAPAMAATKNYVDAAVAAKAAVFISDTPPAGVPDNSLWWESDTGLLFVRYNDGSSSQWVLAMPMPDVAQFVQKVGDIMTGDLSIQKTLPGLVLNDTGGVNADFKYQRNGVNRWLMRMAPDAESGGNAGSSWRMYSYNDAGDTATLALEISRADGRLKLAGDPTVALHAATKQYVDARVRYDAAQALSYTQQAQARANIGVQNFNYMLNGAMMVSQQNGSNAGNAGASGYYGADQWVTVGVGSGVLAVAQNANPTPAGSPNRLRHVVTAAQAALGSTDGFYLSQSIEGFRVADLRFGSGSAKTVTLQFGVRAPTGVYSLAFRNNASNRVYVTTYAISAGEANTDVIKSVTVPGDTAGTWTKDNTTGLRVFWGLAGGSSGMIGVLNAWQDSPNIFANTQTNLMATGNNVFELFDVGLYEGSAAPPFQVPDYASELALCRRYYALVSTGMVWNKDATGRMSAITALPVEMRAAPTCQVATGAILSANANHVTSYQENIAPGTAYNPGAVYANARI